MGAGLLIEPVYNDSQQGGSLLAFIYKAWSERGGGVLLTTCQRCCTSV